VNAVTLYESQDLVNGAAKVGSWTDSDITFTPKTKLSGVARTFYTGSMELHDGALT
jgi:hypothetical protein